VRTLLIANRGEIAIRAARAARELGVTSIAVYAPEDRSALHRLIADRAYEIGEPGHPVRSYLDIPTLIATAREAGADAVYPGYGFLSESAPFAEACREAGLIFVGPSPETLRVAGDKVQGRLAAQRAGVPVLRASGPVIDAVAASRRAPAAAAVACASSSRPTTWTSRSSRRAAKRRRVVRRSHGVLRAGRHPPASRGDPGAR